MKRLAYFAKNMNIGGVEKALAARLNSLDFSQNQVTLVLEEKSGELLSMLDRRIQVEEYPLSTCSFVPIRKAVNFSRRMLWKLCNGWTYDCSCSFCTYSVIGSRLAQYASRNSELWIHNNYSAIYPDEAEYKLFFERLRVRRFSSLVFVSKESLEGFTGLYPELRSRCRVEANIINKDEILRLADEPLDSAPPCGATTFIYIGRLEEEQKRLSRMLEAFKLALEKNSSIRLWIIGDGPDRKKYEELASRFGFAGEVIFLGSQLNPYKYLKTADCLLLTSDYEGFPIVYQEAAILGKPIITTVPASNGEFDIKKHAAIVGRDPAAIAAAMIDFCKR